MKAAIVSMCLVGLQRTGHIICVFGAPLHTLDVTTEGATNVQVASAVLAGSVNPEKQEGTMRFEYGTSSSSLGSSVPASPVHVAGESSVSVSGELLHLELELHLLLPACWNRQ